MREVVVTKSERHRESWKILFIQLRVMQRGKQQQSPIVGHRMRKNGFRRQVLRGSFTFPMNHDAWAVTWSRLR